MICLLVIFIALPLCFVIFSAGKETFIQVFTSAVWKQAMINTAIECVCSSVLSVLIGFLYAYAIVKADIPFKKFFSLIPLIHLITPPFVGGLAFILLLGRQGFITHTLLGLDVSIYGFWGLLIAQVLCFFPMAYLICLQTIQGISTNAEQAAKSMGGKKLKVFFTVTVPLASTGIFSSLLFIAVSVLSDFGNPLIVAGRFRVLAVEIYTQLTGWLNVKTSAVLGIILVVPSILLFIIQKKLYGNLGLRISTVGTKSSSAPVKSTSKLADVLLTVFVAFISLSILAQFAAIIAGSFQKLWGINTKFTLEHIKSVLHYSKELKNSLSFAILAAFFSTTIAVFASYLVHRSSLPLKNLTDTLAQLPAAIPGSLFGLALSITSMKLHITSSSFLIVIAMTMGFLPFAYKIISASFSQIHFSMDNASRGLGASALKSLISIIAPISSGGIFSGFIYSFIRGVGTLSAVIFLVSFNTPLASVKILNLAEEGFWGKSAALALVLTLITFAILGFAMIITKIFNGVKNGKRINSE